MMHFKMMGMIAIVPITMLLVISFFVLFAASKSESKGLKGFGAVLAVLLWLSAVVLSTTCIFVMAKGGPMMMQKMMMMQQMGDKSGMSAQMEKMMQEKMKTGTTVPVKK